MQTPGAHCNPELLCQEPEAVSIRPQGAAVCSPPGVMHETGHILRASASSWLPWFSTQQYVRTPRSV